MEDIQSASHSCDILDCQNKTEIAHSKACRVDNQQLSGYSKVLDFTTLKEDKSIEQGQFTCDL